MLLWSFASQECCFAPLETTKARTCVDNITGERSIESASDASILPAGWDERGKKMWWDATVSLNRLILSNDTAVLLPLTNDPIRRRTFIAETISYHNSQVFASAMTRHSFTKGGR